MIAVATNVLIYAHRVDSPHHARASEVLREVAAGRGTWGGPWPCLHKFLAVVTHPRIYRPSTLPAVAVEAVESALPLPNLRPLTGYPLSGPARRRLTRRPGRRSAAAVRRGRLGADPAESRILGDVIHVSPKGSRAGRPRVLVR